MTTDKLAQMIAALAGALTRCTVDQAEAAVNAASDMMTPDDRTDEAAIESVLDGIRWGARASVRVAISGGAVLRVITPGFQITHEWDSAKDADAKIKAALAAALSDDGAA